MTQPLSLEQRVAALEARYATLSPTEANQPTYLSVNPATGAVSAMFTGSVLLNEANVIAYLNSNSLSWQDSSNVVREFIQGLSQAAHSHQLEVLAQGDPTQTNLARILLTALETSIATPGSSLVQASAFDSGGGGSFGRTILDSLGRSAFLQLVGGAAQQLEVNFGTVAVTFSASNLATQNVNHGLARAPQFAIAASSDSTGFACAITSVTSSQFTLNTFTTAGGAFTGTIHDYWLVIG